MSHASQFCVGIAAIALAICVGISGQFSANAQPTATAVQSESLSIALAADGAASPSDPLDATILDLQQQLRAQGPTWPKLEKLGWPFVEKARVTGDHGYYRLAESCARAMQEGGTPPVSAAIA